MIRLLTGGGLAMPAHIQMDGPTVEDGLFTKETHTQRTHGGSTARYHWLTMCGLTKMVTPPVEFPLWKCAALWSWHTSSCSWEERLCSAPGWAWFPTTRATNIFALLNQKTKQMPTSAFLMQLIVMLHKAGVQLAPSHVKRDFNKGWWIYTSSFHGLPPGSSTTSERGLFPFQTFMVPCGQPTIGT